MATASRTVVLERGLADCSLTDAVSFAVMSERRVRSALTLDGYFRTAGLAMIPAPDRVRRA